MDYHLYLRDGDGRIDDAIAFRCRHDRLAIGLGHALGGQGADLWRGARRLIARTGDRRHPLLAALVEEPLPDEAGRFDPLLARLRL